MFQSQIWVSNQITYIKRNINLLYNSSVNDRAKDIILPRRKVIYLGTWSALDN